MTKVVSHEGQITDTLEMPDWHARHKFWRDILMRKVAFPYGLQMSGKKGPKPAWTNLMLQ